MPRPKLLGATLQRWRHAGRDFTLLGQRVFVRTAGLADRPPLLLIHGFPSASIDWEPLWPELVQRFSVAAPDLLGLGFSAKPAHLHYSVALQADLCQQLLAQLGWSTRVVHVLAHDLGDTVAQELLARHREARLKLGSVVFLNGGLFPESHRPRPIQRLLATPVIGRLLAPLVGKRAFVRAMRAIAGETPPAAAVLDDWWTLLLRERGIRRLPQLLGYLKERCLHRARWVGALTAGDVPVQLVCGSADPISGAHMADRFAELLPQAALVRLPGVGHYPQIEAPTAVLRAVLDFHEQLGRN